MPTFRRVFASLIAILVIVGALIVSQPDGTSTVSADSLKSAGPLRWYRGNLHTHSYWSDGDDFPEMIALWYREHQYDFLCFTDHNVLPDHKKWIDVEKSKQGLHAYGKLKEKFPEGWIDERQHEGRKEVRLKQFDEIVNRIGEPGKFLLIQGEEISDKFDRHPIHLNAANVREVLPPTGGNSVYEVIQNNVDAVIAQRERTRQPMLVHLNHPNFVWGVTAEDLMRVRGENFFEVYNGHHMVKNEGDEKHASTERIWDIVNSMRLTEFDLPLLFGLATDDGHNYHETPGIHARPGRGWVYVLSAELSPTALIENLEAGRFYASSGVALENITSTPKSLSVVVSPDADATYRIDFIGTLRGFDHVSEAERDKEGKKMHATRRYSADIGKILKSVEGTSATYDFTGNELYVRARVTSSRLHPNPSATGEFQRAWTQPVRP